MEKMVKVLVKDLNEAFACSLCNGYFQDAATLCECLDTFCRSCIIRYCLARKQSTIFCPKCNTELGTFSHIIREGIVKDTTKQNVCDVFFPPPKPVVSEQNTLSAILQSKAEPVESFTIDHRAHSTEHKKHDEEKSAHDKKQAVLSQMAPSINLQDAKKTLAPKSLQNILGHKLLSGLALPPAVAGVLQQENEKKRKSTDGTAGESEPHRKKSTTQKESFPPPQPQPQQQQKPTIKPSKGATHHPHAAALGVPWMQKKPAGEGTTTSAPSLAASVPPSALSSTLPTEATTPAEPAVEALVKLLPETNLSVVGSEANILPALPRPTFKSPLNVKILKVQNFVFKRFEDPAKAMVGTAENIDILSEGKSILTAPNLLEFQNRIGGEDKSLVLTYCRLK
jgi:hypothetical protein